MFVHVRSPSVARLIVPRRINCYINLVIYTLNHQDGGFLQLNFPVLWAVEGRASLECVSLTSLRALISLQSCHQAVR